VGWELISALGPQNPFRFRKDGPHTTVAVICRTTAWAFSRGDPFADQQVPIFFRDRVGEVRQFYLAASSSLGHRSANRRVGFCSSLTYYIEPPPPARSKIKLLRTTRMRHDFNILRRLSR
jgi:hypothetical protein